MQLLCRKEMVLKKKKGILQLFHVLLFCYDYVPDVEPGRAWVEKI